MFWKTVNQRLDKKNPNLSHHLFDFDNIMDYLIEKKWLKTLVRFFFDIVPNLDINTYKLDKITASETNS